MNRSRRNVLVVMTLALAAATVAIAGQGYGAHSQRGLQRLQTKLGLSEDQVQAVQAAYAANRETRHQLRSELRRTKADFRQAALNGADASALRAKRDAVQQLTGQLLDLTGKELEEIGSALTPDQRAAFADLKGREHHDRRHGHWRQKTSEDDSTSTGG